MVGSERIPQVECFPTIDAALAAGTSNELVFAIGGGSIYQQLLDRADLLYLTIVDQTPTGDTFFPPYEHLVGPVFRLTRREDFDGFHFMDYERLHEHSA